MALVDFVSLVHKSTTRDYLARVNEFPKAEAARLAKQWGYDYWDGDRKVGYGGMRYDGRWRKVAQAMVDHYQLKPGDRILDVGCGKGFLLFDLTQVLPGLVVKGIDISSYAIENGIEEVMPHMSVASADSLPFDDNDFDLVISINTLHNLYCPQLHRSLQEIERVGRKNKYICVESYRTEVEKVNLLYWQLTCEGFYTPEEWLWWFNLASYTGDHSFIYFE